MIGIYKITNKLNGKSYIGQSIHCDKRFDEHCSGKKQFIDETIQLEGKENFTFELLEECEKDQLNEREDYYIAKYNTMFPSGYNKRWNNIKSKESIKEESADDLYKKLWWIYYQRYPEKAIKLKMEYLYNKEPKQLSDEEKLFLKKEYYQSLLKEIKILHNL